LGAPKRTARDPGSAAKAVRRSSWSAWLDDAERRGLVAHSGRQSALAHSMVMAEVLRRSLGGANRERTLPWSSSRLKPDDRETAPPLIVDLGSGAGIPGLVIAAALGRTRVVLVEASLRRAAFLEEWVSRLGLGNRVEVYEGRAEAFGRDLAWRERAVGVVARGFGPSAVVAECAAPLLALDGVLAVSDPPADDRLRGELPWDEERWPLDQLSELGLQPARRYGAPFSVAVMAKVAATPERYPRRVGVPAKRPLFGGSPTGRKPPRQCGQS
jgi:16S rRNA (guanine527-N7)-methyltransferase